MAPLRTSEDSDIVGGEARSARADDGRVVDAPGRIIIDSAPIETPAPRPAAAAPPRRASGLGLVIVVYILAATALGAAIYERFIA